MTQDAFVRIDAQPCDRAKIVRDSCSITRPTSTPFWITRACPPLSGKSRRALLPRALLARLAAHLDDAGKMRLTDLCNRPSIRAPHDSLDSQARSSRRGDRLRDVPER